MIRDPVVEEVRKAGEEMAREANYDIHTYFENMRKSKQKYADRLVRSIGKPLPSTGTEGQTE